MKKRLMVIPLIVVLLLNWASLLSVSAYTGASSFYSLEINSSNSYNVKFSQNGVFLLHTFVSTSVDVSSLMPSQRNLDLTYFTSGTWQGQDVSSLSSSLWCDQSDTVGFSQTVSISSSGSYFVYSILTCLPCVAGDNFNFHVGKNSFASSYNYRWYGSQLIGVSGIKKIYTDSSLFYSDKTISYTTKSDNQFLVCLFSSDKFTSSSGSFSKSSSDRLASDYSNLSFIGSYPYASIYTSTYGIDKGVDLSLHLQDGIKPWNFSVYEIFTDGTYYPGYDDGSSDDDNSGSSGSSADLSKIEKYLQDIIEILKAGGAGAVNVDPHEFWEVYREGLIELFGFQSSEPEEPEEPPPEESEGEDTTESDSPSFEIDEEQFESAMEYVNTEDLGESITGSTGAVSFFWYIIDRFLTFTNLYPVVAISLILCLATWLIRS